MVDSNKCGLRPPGKAFDPLKEYGMFQYGFYDFIDFFVFVVIYRSNVLI